MFSRSRHWQQVEVNPGRDRVDFPRGASEGHPEGAALRVSSQALYLPLLTLHAGPAAILPHHSWYCVLVEGTLGGARRAAVPSPDYSTSLELPGPKQSQHTCQHTCLQQTTSQRAGLLGLHGQLARYICIYTPVYVCELLSPHTTSSDQNTIIAAKEACHFS